MMTGCPTNRIRAPIPETASSGASSLTRFPMALKSMAFASIRRLPISAFLTSLSPPKYELPTADDATPITPKRVQAALAPCRGLRTDSPSPHGRPYHVLAARQPRAENRGSLLGGFAARPVERAPRGPWSGFAPPDDLPPARMSRTRFDGARFRSFLLSSRGRSVKAPGERRGTRTQRVGRRPATRADGRC